jgi:maltooligosyltrehalose trehalohydrolase
MKDRSEPHVLRELADLAHAMQPPRRVFFEDERNEPGIVKDLGADVVWADDFHHQVHVLLTRERDGYYAAYDGTLEALAQAINDGWTFTGQPYPPWQGRPRGRSPRELGLAPQNLLYCIQNHDQIGNRALGTRLSHHVDADAYCAASVLLLFSPATPLVFMGQEWAASSPFLFFSDHEGALGVAVRQGRREEFKSFAAFADPNARLRIPDPQEKTTFEQSKLNWDERTAEPHARVLATYRAMLALRRNDPVLSAPTSWADFEATAHGDVLEVVRRKGAASRRLVVTFGDREHLIEDADGARVLFASGRFERGRLAPRSAVVLAKD